MGAIYKIFEWLLEPLVKILAFLQTWPGLIISSITTFVSSAVAIWDSFTSLHEYALSFVTQLTTQYGTFSNYLHEVISEVPLIQLVGYSFAFDVLFNSVSGFLAVAFAVLAALFEFFFVAVPVFLLEIYFIKLLIWFICLFIPQGILPSSVEGMSGMNTTSIDNQLTNSL